MTKRWNRAFAASTGVATMIVMLFACGTPAPVVPAAAVAAEPTPPPEWIRSGTHRSLADSAFYAVGSTDSWIAHDDLRAQTVSNRARVAMSDLVLDFIIALVDDFIRTSEGFQLVAPGDDTDEAIERGLVALDESLGTESSEEERAAAMARLRVAAVADARLSLIWGIKRPALRVVTIAEQWDDPNEEYAFALAVLSLETMRAALLADEELPEVARQYFAAHLESVFLGTQ